MGQGFQKPDHGGNFYMTPRRVTASVAWRNLSNRARAVLVVFQHACDGFNNGEIAFGIHEIGKSLGNQNHGANARAVAELIQKGFLELTTDASRALAKVRTYRLTFVSTGKTRAITPATHDYEAWRPTEKRKFGSADIAPKNCVSAAGTAPNMKVSGADIAPEGTESRGFEGQSIGASPALLLDNHSVGSDRAGKSPVQPLKISPETRAADLRADLDTLRAWVCEAVDRRGYGGARALAQDAGISEVALSRFRRGKNLPEQYRVRLQEACARTIPFNQMAA